MKSCRYNFGLGAIYPLNLYENNSEGIQLTIICNDLCLVEFFKDIRTKCFENVIIIVKNLVLDKTLHGLRSIDETFI